MANTITYGNGTLKIVPDGSADWLYSDDGLFPNGMNVVSIQFCPSAQNDVMIVHDQGIDGVEMFNSGIAPGTTPIIKYYPSLNGHGKFMKPVIDISDCTLSTPGNAAIFIEYIPQG